MPQYLWKCLECDKLVEVERPISDYRSPPEACDCGGRWERLISPGTFLLKGGGWFEDGYNKEKKK